MRGVRAIATAAAVLMTVAACSSKPDRTPGAVSADEASQLNDAAAMLDANSIDANAVDTTADTPTRESTPQ